MTEPVADELVRVDLDDGVATITLDDGRHNALSVAMSAAIGGALDRAEEAGAAVVLAGAGRSFCAGLDLKGADLREMAAEALAVSRRLLSFPHPTVIACNGSALAMGAFLLLSSDVRVGAAGGYKVGLTEVTIGLTFPASGLALAAHRLNPPAYDRCLITGEALTPEGAAAAGFLDQVVPADELAARAGQVATTLRAVDRQAHLATKLAIRGDVLARIDEQIERLRTPGGGW